MISFKSRGMTQSLFYSNLRRKQPQSFYNQKLYEKVAYYTINQTDPENPVVLNLEMKALGALIVVLLEDNVYALMFLEKRNKIQ